METAHRTASGGTFRRLLIFGALTVGLLAMIASSVSATNAYFSDTAEGTSQVSSGEVTINSAATLNFGDVMPGESVQQTFTVQNTGDGNVDLYGWIESEDNASGDNLCGLGFEVQIDGWGKGWQELCSIAADLENDTSLATVGANAPVVLGTDVTNEVTVNVSVRLAETAGNDAADLDSLTDTLVIYATQASAPPLDLSTATFNGYSATDVFGQ